MPGPPPNPNAIRRNPRVGLVVLPAEGYKGTLPKWPLPPNPRLQAKVELLEDEIETLEDRDLDDGLSRTEKTKLSRTRERLKVAQVERDAIVEGEKELWRKLWRTPQAAAWARLRWDRDVAQYVRHKAAAEIGSIDDSREARQRGHHLGLTPKGMKDLMWVIADDEVGAQRQASQPQVATGTNGGGSVTQMRRRPKASKSGEGT